MQIVIPMAGEASRFKNQGITTPKPLLDVFGIPLAVRSAKSIKDYGRNIYLFISLVEHKKWGIESRIREHIPNSHFIYLKQVTSGPIATCLIAANELQKNLPVVFNDCDHVFKSEEFDAFLQEQIYGPSKKSAILYFNSSDPKFSYIKTFKLNNIDLVQQAQEKKVISNYAVCGTYNFATVEIFTELARKCLEGLDNNEKYMIELIDQMAKNKYHIEAIRAQYHKSLGTPEEYRLAINDYEFRNNCNEL
jgi:NDP-sugar pyrophosphorylase family protein